MFNLLDNSHSQGVCNFTCDHLRIEHSTNNALLLHSQWPQGNISFRNLDQSSQTGTRPTTQNYVQIERINTMGSIYKWEDCQLSGTHTYTANSNDNLFQSRAVYNGCTLIDNPCASDFLINSIVSGGSSCIEASFDNCRNGLNTTTAGYREVVDCNPNWYINAGGYSRRRTINLVPPPQAWPSGGGSFHVRIPRNCLILAITFLKSSAQGFTGAFQYTLTTNEVSPTTLAGGASTPMAGANANLAIAPVNVLVSALAGGFFCASDLQRELIITDTLTRTNVMAGAQLVIEYI
jgi:hypothetical protein